MITQLQNTLDELDGVHFKLRALCNDFGMEVENAEFGGEIPPPLSPAERRLIRSLSNQLKSISADLENIAEVAALHAALAVSLKKSEAIS